MGFLKGSLIPEKVMTYLGIECDSLRGKFAVPEVKIAKYWPFWKKHTNKGCLDSDVEHLVGKLVSLECTVPAGM